MMWQERSCRRGVPALRERTHQSLILLAIAALLVLGLGPLVAHHAPAVPTEYLAGRNHLLSLCLVALSVLMAPVHLLFHVLLVGGLGYALWDRARAWRSLDRVLAPLAARTPRQGDPFRSAALLAGVDPLRLRIVRDLPTPAFTAGWLRPRIYLAEALLERLSPEELTAVLSHEGAHVARRDPLRLSVLRFLACLLFWIPALRRLTEDLADEVEIRADDVAARGRPLALASALLALAGWARPCPTPDGVGFDERDLLERRIRRLAGEAVQPRSRVTRCSLLLAGIALFLSWTSGVAAAVPPSEHTHHAAHCEHDDLPAVYHLFCLGFSLSPARVECPHDLHA